LSHETPVLAQVLETVGARMGKQTRAKRDRLDELHMAFEAAGAVTKPPQRTRVTRAAEPMATPLLMAAAVLPSRASERQRAARTFASHRFPDQHDSTGFPDPRP
jgi:hypothetical protein